MFQIFHLTKKRKCEHCLFENNRRKVKAKQIEKNMKFVGREENSEHKKSQIFRLKNLKQTSASHSSLSGKV